MNRLFIFIMGFLLGIAVVFIIIINELVGFSLSTFKKLWRIIK